MNMIFQMLTETLSIFLTTCIYSAKVLRINFTTYDVHHDQDSMNPRTHCNVMVLSPESEEDVHPFWYVQVLGVFHTHVLHVGPVATNQSVQNIKFLWVWWLGLVPNHQYGFKSAHLPKVRFVEYTDLQAFGFLDPLLVVWGCHLVPAFADGKTLSLLPFNPTATHSPDEHEDWVAFYVMM